jgi:preprotein translocase subunit SecE
MGRILRKKSTSLKKKKKQDTENAPAEAAETAAGAGSGSTAAAAEEAEPTAKSKPALVPKKSQATFVAEPVSPPADNVFTRSIQFLREVKIELKKVTWPSRKQTTGSTLVVIVLVIIISAFLGIVDMGLSGLIRAIFK